MKCIAKSIFDFYQLLIHTPLINNAVFTSELHSSLFCNPCFQLFVNTLHFWKKWVHPICDWGCIINYVIFNSGVLAFDKTSGFWVVSSVPRFPAQVKHGFTYKDPQTKYGQTIFCVTVRKDEESCHQVSESNKKQILKLNIIVHIWIFYHK